MDCFTRIIQHSTFIEKQSPSAKSHGIFYIGSTSDYRPEMIRFQERLRGSSISRRRLILLLPGRWRRPFHDDSRYGLIARSFDDHPKMSICYYSLAFGPVPLELDETFPIAQTESRDSAEPELFESKVSRVVQYVKSIRPIRLIVIEEGEYGKKVANALVKLFGKRQVSILAGEKLKPQAIIRMIEKTVQRIA